MNFKKFLPHLIAIAVFVAITLAYFSPLLSGKKVNQSDISNWTGASKELNDFRAQHHSEALWTNSMFGGMPAYQISVVYGGNLIQYINKIIMLGLPDSADYVFLYLLGFYFLLIVLGIDNKVAILGAIAFAFSSFFFIVIEVGHNSQAHAIGYMAPMLAGIILTYRGRLLLGTALTGLFLALEIYANHPQITYYLALIVIIFGIIELINSWKEKRLNYFFKATGSLLAVAALAVCTNAASLMATAEYGKYSTRGPSELTANKENQTSGLDRDYITGWSYGIGESFTLLIPDFKGGASEAIGTHHKDALKDVDGNYKQNIAQTSSYFGDMPFTAGPFYAGAITCLLFVIGLFVIKGPMKWWIVIASLLGLMLSWGKHFMGFTNFFLDVMPGYDKFRTVMMTLVIVSFMLPLLASLALDSIMKNSDFIAQNKKKINYGIAIVLGLCLLIMLVPSLFTSFYTQDEYDRTLQQVQGQKISQDVIDGYFSSIETARKAIFNADALRTFFFVLIASGLIFSFVKFKFKKEYLIYSLIFLVLIDMWSVDRRYLSDEDFVRKASVENPFPMSQADQAILQDQTKSYRVLNLAANTFNDASTSFYHQSIGGYHGAKLKRYKELIDYRIDTEMQNLSEAMKKQDSTMLEKISSQPVLNMLNAKYFIYNPEAPPLQNRGALGNAWFVSEIKFVPNADSEIAALNNFNPKTTAIVDERYKEQFNGFTPAKFIDDTIDTSTISLTNYLPNDLTYHSNSSAEQLAVFSEIFYDKGWNAYVDGKLMPHARANYVLRAMRIPAGEHNIEFKFEPTVYSSGEKISLASSALLILLVAGIGWMEFKKKTA